MGFAVPERTTLIAKIKINHTRYPAATQAPLPLTRAPITMRWQSPVRKIYDTNHNCDDPPESLFDNKLIDPVWPTLTSKHDKAL